MKTDDFDEKTDIFASAYKKIVKTLEIYS